MDKLVILSKATTITESVLSSNEGKKKIVYFQNNLKLVSLPLLIKKIIKWKIEYL